MPILKGNRIGERRGGEGRGNNFKLNEKNPIEAYWLMLEQEKNGYIKREDINIFEKKIAYGFEVENEINLKFVSLQDRHIRLDVNKENGKVLGLVYIDNVLCSIEKVFISTKKTFLSLMTSVEYILLSGRDQNGNLKTEKIINFEFNKIKK